MESSKILIDFTQKSTSDYVLQVQDLQKRAPKDLINFPKGSLGPSWGAPPHFWSPPWILLEPHWCHSEEKTKFLENHENIGICNVWGAWAATTRPPEH